MLPDDPLRDLQQQVVRELLYRDAPAVASRIVAGGLDVQRRLGIYRTNARENFALALEAAFPLLLRCTGPVEFRQIAWAYQRACPSPAGNLFHVGRRLPAYLAGQLRGDADEYLIDVATLEWQVQEALVAADGDGALDLAALAAVPAERQGDIRFRLHPSVRLLRTDHGVFSLWEGLQREIRHGQAASVPALGPASRGAEHLLVWRCRAGVQLERLPASDFAGLEALQGGATLDATVARLASTLLATPAATPAAAAGDPLGSLLVRWTRAGVITAFH